MQLYLESLKTDIDIASIDCDIKLDRYQLSIDIFENIVDLYKESTDNAGISELYAESTDSFVNVLKKAINAVISFIKQCVEKVKEMTTSVKFAKLKQKYEKAIKENPKLKDVEITYKDNSECVKIADNGVEKIYRSYSKKEDVIKAIEDHKTKQKNAKTVVKTITIGAAIGLVGTLSSLFFINTKKRDNLLKEIQDTYDKACNFDVSKHTKLWKSAKTILNSNDEEKISQYAFELEPERVRHVNQREEVITAAKNFKHQNAMDSINNPIKYIINTIKFTTKQDLEKILEIVNITSNKIESLENEIIDMSNDIKNTKK